MRDLIGVVVIMSCVLAGLFLAHLTTGENHIASQCESMHYFVVDNKVYGCKLYRYLGEEKEE